jgi:thioredoxin 1
MADGHRSSLVQHVDDSNFESEVLASDKPYLVEFGAAWCGPCKALAPIVRALAAEMDGELRAAEIDIDDAPRVASSFGVRAVPTVIVFRQGRETARHVGLLSKEKLRALAQR